MAIRIPVRGVPLVTVASLAVAAQLAFTTPSPAAGAGIISTVAGGIGGPGPARTVAFELTPRSVTFGGGYLYIVDGAVRKVNPRTGYLTTPVGAYSMPTFGFPYVPVGDGWLASKTDLSADTAALAPGGNIAIADTGDYRVRLVPDRSGTYYGVKMIARHIYTVAGNGSAGYSGDRGPATLALVNVPGGIAVDHSGNLVVADTGNYVVRVIAARSGTFYGIKMRAGYIYTVAGDGRAGYSGDGGLATKAKFWAPQSVELDHAGNLLIADMRNARVRVVAVRAGTFYGQKMLADHVYTVAGDGRAGYSGDGGPATKAELNAPSDASVDVAGNLVLSDQKNRRVRAVAVWSGTF
jgi:trimeric autotransporter adhesin